MEFYYLFFDRIFIFCLFQVRFLRWFRLKLWHTTKKHQYEATRMSKRKLQIKIDHIIVHKARADNCELRCDHHPPEMSIFDEFCLKLWHTTQKSLYSATSARMQIMIGLIIFIDHIPRAGNCEQGATTTLPNHKFLSIFWRILLKIVTHNSKIQVVCHNFKQIHQKNTEILGF